MISKQGDFNQGVKGRSLFFSFSKAPHVSESSQIPYNTLYGNKNHTNHIFSCEKEKIVSLQ